MNHPVIPAFDLQVKVRPRSLVQICLQRIAENFLRLGPHNLGPTAGRPRRARKGTGLLNPPKWMIYIWFNTQHHTPQFCGSIATHFWPTPAGKPRIARIEDSSFPQVFLVPLVMFGVYRFIGEFLNSLVFGTREACPRRFRTLPKSFDACRSKVCWTSMVRLELLELINDDWRGPMVMIQVIGCWYKSEGVYEKMMIELLNLSSTHFLLNFMDFST